MYSSAAHVDTHAVFVCGIVWYIDPNNHKPSGCPSPHVGMLKSRVSTFPARYRKPHSWQHGKHSLRERGRDRRAVELELMDRQW